MPYLSDRLTDSDPGVRNAAISTIYEITRINPLLFIVTIPKVFQIFCEGEVSNWCLIKLIKLLVEFSENEPRLLQKLEPKFRELLESQKSKSVQYELI